MLFYANHGSITKNSMLRMLQVIYLSSMPEVLDAELSEASIEI